MTSRTWLLLARSVGLSFIAAFLAVALAFAAALLMDRRTSRALAPWLLMAMLVPPCIFAQGWIFFFDRLGIPFSGMAGAVWVSVFYFFPLCFALIGFGLQTLDRTEWEAAALILPPLTRFRTIILPQSRHLLVGAGLLAFLLSLGDFSIPSGFQVNVYAMDIYAQFSVRANAGSAFFHALPLLAVSLAAAVLGYSSFRALALAQIVPPDTGKSRKGRIHAAVTAALVAVPIAALFFNLPAPSVLFTVLRDSAGSLASTFHYGALAVLTTLPPAFAASVWLGQRPGRLAYGLTVLPLAIPAPLTGIALIALLINTPLYTTSWLLGIGYAARLTPIAAMMLFFLRRSRDSASADARRLFQRNRKSGFFRVTLPSCMPAFIAGGICVFVLAAGETAVTLLLVPPGASPLSLSTYNLLHYGAGDLVAATCFFLLAVCALLIGAGSGLRFFSKRRFQ